MNTDDTPAFTELRNFPAKDESVVTMVVMCLV